MSHDSQIKILNIIDSKAPGMVAHAQPFLHPGKRYPNYHVCLKDNKDALQVIEKILPDIDSILIINCDEKEVDNIPDAILTASAFKVVIASISSYHDLVTKSGNYNVIVFINKPRTVETDLPLLCANAINKLMLHHAVVNDNVVMY